MLWGRTARCAIWFILAVVSLPLAVSQASAALSLDLPQVEPGSPIVATFTTSAPWPIDLAVQDHVSCTISGPEGETLACDIRGDIVAVRLAAATTYTIPLAAPAAPGDFEVRVSRAPLADSVVMASSAAAPLAVRVPEPLEAANETAENLDPAPPAPTGAPHFLTVIFGSRDGTPAPPASDDSARWVVSSSAGTATLAVLLLGSRFGGRP